MNYIHRLQADLARAEATERYYRDAIQSLRALLASPKFRQPDPTGERRDWISTADMDLWAQQTLSGAADVAVTPPEFDGDCTICGQPVQLRAPHFTWGHAPDHDTPSHPARPQHVRLRGEEWHYVGPDRFRETRSQA